MIHYGPNVTRTAAQSRKKSRCSLNEPLLLDVTLSLKFALLRSAAVQLRPQVSVGDPNTVVCSAVVSTVSVFIGVHVAPPSDECSTLMLLVPIVLLSRQSRRTSMPLTLQLVGVVRL